MASQRKASSVADAAQDSSGWTNRPAVPELQQKRSVTPKEERTPWDWKRFVSQSSKFVEPPNPFKKREDARVLAAGDSFGELQLFPLDDVVMGGASASTFDNDSREWSGEVTSRNSGGFVGIRSKLKVPLDVSATQGIELKLRPDGKERRFKFSLRDNGEFNGITWAASFSVGSTASRLTNRILADGVETVRIPYSTLIPTIFAKTVPDAVIDLTNIEAVQFTLSKFEYNGGLNPLFEEGNFELGIVDVGTY